MRFDVDFHNEHVKRPCDLKLENILNDNKFVVFISTVTHMKKMKEQNKDNTRVQHAK